ncbi:MAG: hypothetical protein GY869_15520, partial [Planctomycetes bacterium]|nr:hypothetical protein [Planctomycetota bacterium]
PASDAQAWDYFGCWVSVAGDVVVVGAKYEDSVDGNAGAAYIFERNMGGINVWGQAKKLIASDGQSGAEFGWSTAVAGDVVIIGAYRDNSGTGAAYIYERNASGINAWGQVRKLIASDAEPNDWFGQAVAVYGDVAVVGARYEDSGALNGGAVYIFERNSGGVNVWGQTKKLLASDAQASDWFGRSVAIAGDVLIAGGQGEDSGGYNSGAAYVFERNAGSANAWGQVKKLTASDPEESDQFGRTLSMAGDVVLVGAWQEDAGGSDAGAAYIFENFIILAPLVNNGGGAADITVNSATLRGEVTRTGGDDPDVIIFWGDDDGGIITGNWDHAINKGTQTGSFSSAIAGLVPNKTYYYRCYATNSGGTAWAPATTNFTTLGSPFIDITNSSPININYNTEIYEISGTNLYIAGQLAYVNNQHPASTNYFAPGFSVTISNINHGNNLITVFGTNVLGMVTNDFLIIHRETFEEVHPFIKITNTPTEVAYNISSAQISGTNLHIAGDLGWVNDQHPDTTNFFA